MVSGWGWRCEVRECMGSASDLGPMGLLMEQAGREYRGWDGGVRSFFWKTRCPEGLLFIPWGREEPG